MKRYSIPAIFILLIAIGCTVQQKIVESTNEHLDLHRLIMSKGITENIDSMINIEFKSIRSKLQTSKDQQGIERYMIGNWTGDRRTRINGKEAQPIKESKFSFLPEFYFLEINSEDTLRGEYLVQRDSSSNLVLIYDEPRYPPFPEEMLENMTKEELEEHAYRIRLLNIFEITRNRMIFYNVVPLIDYSNPQTITHSRLVLEEYVKE